MKIIDLEQGSDAWLKWRMSGIGSSDAPVIMGESPYKTIDELYEEKAGLSQPQDVSNFAIERGKRIEPRVRAMVESVYNETFTPLTIESSTYDCLHASLDGYSAESQTLIEIKLIGEDDFKSGKCPSKYYAQIQHQLIVSGAKKAIYIGYYIPKDEPSDLKGTLVIEDIPHDHEYQHQYLVQAFTFWKFLQSKVSPTQRYLVDQGYSIDETKALLAEHSNLAKQIKQLETKKDKLKATLDDIFKNTMSAKVDNYSITRVERIGVVDNKKMAQELSIDVEKYRKPGSVYYVIKESK